MGKYTPDDIKQMILDTYRSMKIEKSSNESSEDLLRFDPIFRRENLEMLARICEYLDMIHEEEDDEM